MTYWPAFFVGQSISVPPAATSTLDGLETAAEHVKLAGVTAGATALAIGTTTGTAYDGGLGAAATSKLAGIASGATANTLAVGTTTGTAYDGGLGAALTTAAALPQPATRQDVAITIPSASTTNGVAYTVPAGKLFDFEKALLVIDTPITGAGSCVVSLGVAAGGQEYLVNVTLTSANTAGVAAGVTLLSLGAAMLAAQGFEAVLAAAATITWQCVTTGSVSVGAVRVIVKGMLI